MDAIVPGETRIGWIGTGVMGEAMAGHLLDAGYALTIYNRSTEKTRRLQHRGAEAVSSPAEVIQRSSVVLTIVGYPADVREVYFSSAGLIPHGSPGKILVDMTTSPPSLAEEIYQRGLERGMDCLDAPVSGGDIGAREARLSIMVGGRQEIFDRLWPLWERIGKTIVFQGPPGAGQHTKMVNQILIASNMIGVCEALLYASRAGLDLKMVLQSVSSGAAGSWSLSNLAPRMIAGDFAPGFLVDHFLKDLGIALDEAARMDLALPGLGLAKQLYQAVRAQGHGRSGTQALVRALAHLSHCPWNSLPQSSSLI